MVHGNRSNSIMCAIPCYAMLYYTMLQILVCSVVTTALEHCSGPHGTSAPPSGDLEATTSLLRESKMHFLLMAHVFWYIRDKDIMQKVRELLLPPTELTPVLLSFLLAGGQCMAREKSQRLRGPS